MADTDVERDDVPAADVPGGDVLTANDLLSGRIVWWTGEGWSEAFADARADTAEALAAIAAREEAANRVVGALAVPLGEDGRPTGLREGRRLAGPSPSLSIPAATAHGA